MEYTFLMVEFCICLFLFYCFIFTTKKEKNNEKNNGFSLQFANLRFCIITLFFFLFRYFVVRNCSFQWFLSVQSSWDQLLFLYLFLFSFQELNHMMNSWKQNTQINYKNSDRIIINFIFFVSSLFLFSSIINKTDFRVFQRQTSVSIFIITEITNKSKCCAVHLL